MCVIVFPSSKWQKLKINFLKRIIILAQARHVSPQGTSNLSDTSVKDFTVYKSYLLFFGLIDGLYKKMFKVSLILIIKLIFIFGLHVILTYLYNKLLVFFVLNMQYSEQILFF